MSTNNTFRANTLANASGVKAINGQTLTVQFLTANPANVPGVPAIWYNVTDFKMYTYDGTTQRSSAALA